jgi:hypothetical protein
MLSNDFEFFRLYHFKGSTIVKSIESDAEETEDQIEDRFRKQILQLGELHRPLKRFLSDGKFAPRNDETFKVLQTKFPNHTTNDISDKLGDDIHTLIDKSETIPVTETMFLNIVDRGKLRVAGSHDLILMENVQTLFDINVPDNIRSSST